ncbi:type I polyketide synthase [Pseudosporangium ferrugineum]|uniref:Acyl transferase domain-containing protein n=1 Tax=Pseudosporangium ferrugineum TaxID=439699 RepID=A0A2T0SET1_9ACTN|nr:type I polyketide synthase [Pseudosporangium ferrugineum]PRY31853.1 acyl transferase domain-containing protein [Pseudosporangium ferrugineum]
MTGDEDIAIVGMAGRFPGAADVEEFWSNVASGRISIRTLDRADLLASGVPAAEADDPAYVPARGVLADADLFDADFFGVVPGEAALMDPQHRLLLQTAWEALESGGLITAAPPGWVGTFAGAGFNYYLHHTVLADPATVRDHGLLAVVLGNEKDHLAAKLAYRLNLAGPAVTVQTACSTSLTAVHLACQSLRAGDCDVALAGGVCVAVPQHSGYLYEPKGILSPDGTCRPFDAAAAGTVPGNAVAVVALKRASDAARDGDLVHAVIKGSAINNDGGAKVGYTAPGVAGQADVLRRAYANAGVDPATVGYLEAHGTATEVGDEIELAALTEVFGKRAADAPPCSLGSVKANVGHLDAAAGVAGLIKVALALRARRIPPLAGLGVPRDEFASDSFPFTLDPAARPWTVEPGGVRRGSVSSFGLGGTNVHVVLEEAPRPGAGPDGGPASRPALLTVSARTPDDLAAARRRLAASLTGSVSLRDAALTLQSHRRPFRHRQAIVARDVAQAVRDLSRDGGRAAARRPSLVFLLPGQGAEFPGMAADVYAAHPSVRADVDRAARILAPLLGLDLRDVLLDRDASEELIHRTDVAQPALLVHGYALGRLLTTWGLRPGALLGHSVGEFTAACLAGELGFGAALRLVAKRGALMRDAPPGGMLIVFAGEDEVRPHLGDLDLAAVNGPRAVVVAGPAGALDGLRGRLDAAGLTHRALPARRAFHSRMMTSAAEEFGRYAATVAAHDRRLDVIDASSGDLLERGGHRDAAAWARQLRSPVRFDRAARTALALPRPVFLEVGPGRALTGAVRQAGGTPAATVAVQPDRRADGGDALVAAVGELWAAGAGVDWAAFRGSDGARRAVLPTYPFARTRHWLTSGPGRPVPSAPVEEAPPPSAGTTVERVMGIWRDVLGIAGVTSESNFFDLGGESLLFLRMIARTRRAFGVPIDVEEVSRRPTPDTLAALVDAAGRG